MNASRSAPETVFLHIGLHKTGTTYLQNVMRANREAAREHGLEFPGSQGEPMQAHAVWDLQGRRPRGARDVRIAGAWAGVVDVVNNCGRPRALISEERLSLSTLKQVRTAVRAFPDSEVRVIVTVRDLGRVAVSAWQEEVKNDKTWTWPEFVAAIQDPAAIARNPARGFWLRQDVVKICETWESAVPPSRIHIVTVPQSPAPPGLLLSRFTGLLGLEAAQLPAEPKWSNETIGVAATEVIRRLNIRLGGGLNQRQYDQVVKNAIAPTLARRADAVRFTLPAEQMDWALGRADEIITALAARGYPVVGDLEELRPRVREGRRPDEFTDPELVEASLDALTVVTERLAASWWRTHRTDIAPESGADLGSRARAAVFKAERRAAEIADHNPAAAKAVGALLKVRDRARTRARKRRERAEGDAGAD